MTTPGESDSGREVGPLGSAVAPPADEASQGGSDRSAGEVAGPSYPPAESEPDAHPDED